MIRIRTAALILAVSVLLSAAAFADVDPQVADIIAGMKARGETVTTTYADMDVEIKVNGQTQEKYVQEIWVKNEENIRIERTDGTVILRTPTEFLVFEGRTKIMLHMPQATVDALEGGLDDAVAALGMEKPEDALKMFDEMAQHMTLAGEVTLDEAQCWILDIGAEGFEIFRKQLKDIPDEFTIESAQLTVDKELFASRGAKITMTGPAQLEINQMVWTIADGAEIEDELFTYEAPEDATIMTWTPEDEADEIMERYRNAVRDALIKQMQQGAGQ